MSTRSAPTEVLPVSELVENLDEIVQCAKKARKHGFRLASHEFYYSKARAALASARKHLLLLKRTAERSRDDELVQQVQSVEAMLTDVDLESEPLSLIKSARSLKFHLVSDLSAAFEPSGVSLEPNFVFLPPEIVPNGVYRRVVEEVNSCFSARCYNACAAMLRRLVESLIIEAFEAKGIEDKIKIDGEYQEMKALIGKASAEPQLRLGRNTKDALPQLKFFGDLSVHSRRNLVRLGDLNRLHNAIRVALEELAQHLLAS